ncbi:MAG: protein NO VEIN domain-containing protein, partial [Aquificaceae bacterium]
MIDEEYIRKIKDALGESLATRHIDYTRIKEMAQKAKEYRLIPEYVEEFFKRAFEKAGGKFRIRKDGFLAIESIPYEIRKIAEETDFKNRYGMLPKHKSYPKATFDKDLAFKNPDVEFISFGHPLFEALLEWIKRKYFPELHRGAVFEDPEGRYEGIIWFFEGEVSDGKGAVAGKKLIAIYDDGKEYKEINPAILWDLVPVDTPQGLTFDFDYESKKRRAQEYAINVVEAYKEELLKERERQAEIKQKYGVRSLEYLIGELDVELVELCLNPEGKEVAIKNKEERKRYYEDALKKLKREIEQEKSLLSSMPRLLGAIYVRRKSAFEMVSDEEIERIGMQVAMEYERSQGREPEDVSKENLGFDIRSKGKDEIRYIEVKARRDEGDVALT